MFNIASGVRGCDHFDNRLTSTRQRGSPTGKINSTNSPIADSDPLAIFVEPSAMYRAAGGGAGGRGWMGG